VGEKGERLPKEGLLLYHPTGGRKKSGISALLPVGKGPLDLWCAGRGKELGEKKPNGKGKRIFLSAAGGELSPDYFQEGEVNTRSIRSDWGKKEGDSSLGG